MLPHYQRHPEDNLEAAERREQRLMELLRQSNEMQKGMGAHHLGGPSRRDCPHSPEPFQIPPIFFRGTKRRRKTCSIARCSG